jgi:hypothetical protein
MTIRDDVFEAMPARPYGEVRSDVRNGDILLCSAHDFGSRMIRWATRSRWSHCGVAFRLDEIDRILVLECVQHIGVRAVPLSDFISRTSNGTHPYPGRIVLARHVAAEEFAAHEMTRAMSEFAFDRLGDKFSQLETLKIAIRIILGRLGIVMPAIARADDEFICSEYVARCFETVGHPIPWDGLGFIAPSDIAADPAVTAVAHVRTR